MKKLSLLLACSSTLLAQTYPGGIYTPLIAANNLQTTLTAPMAAIDTVAVVAASAGWVNNSLAYICDSTTSTIKCTGTFEIMKVTNVSGNVLTVTRGLGGTSAIAHASGKAILNSPVALYNKTVNDEVFAIETALGANMANIPGSPSGGVVPVVKGGTGVTTAQGNGSKVQLSTGATATNDCVKFDANGNTADSGLPCNTLPAATAQLQQLRVKPNTGNLTTDEFADPTLVNAKDYNYTAQQPGGSLTGAVGASVTLTPCPLGVLGTDTRLRFHISGGSGAAESVASTGAGTCTSGATTGSVTFTPANSHSGAWTIQSSHAGIYEAVAANPGREVRMPGGTYTMRDCMTFDPTKPLLLSGDGSSTTGTFLNFGTVTSGCNAISMTDSAVTNNEPKIFRNFAMQGTGTTTGGSGMALTQVVRVTLDHVQINSFAADALFTNNAFEINVKNGCAFFYNGHWGWEMAGASNLNRAENSYLGTNSRSNGYGGVLVVGQSAIAPTQQITLDGVDLSNNGSVPFTAVTTSYGLFAQWVTGITVINGYNEGNITNAELFQGAATGITEFNNWYNSAPVVYASDVPNVNSWGNTFYGAAAVRTFNNPDLSKYTIGPDNCLNASGECAAHPKMLGSISSMSVTGAATAAKAWNYIATESGANNAIVAALLDQSGAAVPLAAGLCGTVKLAHTLQAGANTFNFNGAGAKSIKKHTNAATDLSVAYAATGFFGWCYDGTQFLDMGQ